MQRGKIWWTDLGPPKVSSPARSRPVSIVQADSFNASRVGTVIVAAITSAVVDNDQPTVRLGMAIVIDSSSRGWSSPACEREATGRGLTLNPSRVQIARALKTAGTG